MPDPYSWDYVVAGPDLWRIRIVKLAADGRPARRPGPAAQRRPLIPLSEKDS